MNTQALPSTNTVDLSLFPAKVRKLFDLKGQIVTLRTMKDCKVRKGESPIVKDSTFQARIGVNYDNIAAVQEKRELGILPAENAGLPWGNWVEGLFPYVIEHKGEYYFRCTMLHNAHSVHKRRFLRNGIEISVDEAKAACLASEFKDMSDNDVFCIKVNNIVEINGKDV
jgi:hypothetical protein